MRSSDPVIAQPWFSKLTVAFAGLALMACSAPPHGGGPTATVPASDACAAARAALTPADGASAESLQHSVQRSPLYAAASAATAVARCSIRAEAGAVTIHYQFHDGTWLQVKRDQRIEYTEQEARFAVPPAGEPVEILARAERAAFGAGGCGIDFQHGETGPLEGDALATETTYRGDSCNCQARVRRSAAGGVIGLLLRSAC